jgi:hypothetical protein
VPEAIIFEVEMAIEEIIGHKSTSTDKTQQN